MDPRITLIERAIDTHGSALLGYLTQLTRNPHDADDLFNELWIFVQARFKDEHICEFGLLRRKAYQLFVDSYRRAIKNPVVSVDSPPDSPSSSILHEPLSEEEEAHFKKKFFEDYPVPLPDAHRECLWLHCRCGYTFTEIASIMGKPSSTIGDWVTSARNAFTDYFNTNH